MCWLLTGTGKEAGKTSCEAIQYGSRCFPESFHVRRGKCVNGCWEFSFPKLEFDSYQKLDICPDNYEVVYLIRLWSNEERCTRSSVKKMKKMKVWVVLLLGQKDSTTRDNDFKKYFNLKHFNFFFLPFGSPKELINSKCRGKKNVKVMSAIKWFPPWDVTSITTWVAKCIWASWWGHSTTHCLLCPLIRDVYQLMKLSFDQVLLWYGTIL